MKAFILSLFSLLLLVVIFIQGAETQRLRKELDDCRFKKLEYKEDFFAGDSVFTIVIDTTFVVYKGELNGLRVYNRELNETEKQDLILIYGPLQNFR